MSAFSLRSTTIALLLGVLVTSCTKGPSKPLHRERDATRDKECRAPERPRAFFYPAENRTDYKPDDPNKDKCEVLVLDHLFCCPDAPRPTDR